MTPWCEERGGKWYCDKDPAATGPRGGNGQTTCPVLEKACAAPLAPVHGGKDCCNCYLRTNCSDTCKKVLSAYMGCIGVLKCPGVCGKENPEPEQEYEHVPLDTWSHSFTGENGVPLVAEGTPPPGMPNCKTADSLGKGCPCVRADHCDPYGNVTNPQ